ncbi:MAG: tetratricopeptide repeat protein [bacterium]
MRRLAPFAILVAVIVLVFGRGVRHEFVDWDDGPNIFENPGLNPVTPSSVAAFWSAPYAKLYAPLTYTAWSAIAAFAPRDAVRGRLDASLFHLANLALHAIAACLVFVLLRAIVRVDLAAMCGAIVFALHPVQVEAVAWATGLKDLLSGVFALTAIALYLHASAERSDDPNRFGGPSRAMTGLALATIAFFLALLAKPSATVVPILTWLLERGRGDARTRRVAPILVAWCAIAVVWAIVTMRAQPGGSLAAGSPLWHRPLIACDAIAFYLGKLAWPAALAADYGRTPKRVVAEGLFVAPCVALIALVAAAWLSRRRTRQFFAAIALFAAALLPVLGLIPFGFQEYSTVADRYLYLAMLGPAMAVAFVAARANPRAVVVSTIVLACVLGVRSARQVGVWRDTRTLFEHALGVNPRSWVANTGLGVVAARDGRDADAARFYSDAIRANPDYADAHYNLGLVAGKGGDGAEAKRLFSEAIRLRADFADAHNALGVILAREGRIDDAASAYEAALASKPRFGAAHANLGALLAKAGRYDEALDHLRAAIRLQPGDARARNNAGGVLARLGRTREAAEEFRAAASADPDSWEAHKNLATALASLGDAAGARASYETARRLRPSLPPEGPQAAGAP